MIEFLNSKSYAAGEDNCTVFQGSYYRVLRLEIIFLINAYFCLQLVLLCKSTLQITIVLVLDSLDQNCGSFLLAKNR